MSNYYHTQLKPRIRRFTQAIGAKRTRKSLPELPRDFDEQVLGVWRAVSAYTMTGPERVEALVNAVRHVVKNGIPGGLVECGVWRGGSAMAMALVLKELGETQRNLYLYDTFQGMTAPTAVDVSIDGKAAETKFARRKLSENSSEWCRAPLDDVRRNLASTGYPVERVHFVEGKVEDTIPHRMPAGPIAVLRLDTDWYESTLHELEHLYPRLSRGGILIIDDYGHWTGAKQAVDEYVSRHQLALFLARVDETARIAIKP